MRPDSNINNNARKLDRPRRLIYPGSNVSKGAPGIPDFAPAWIQIHSLVTLSYLLSTILLSTEWIVSRDTITGWRIPFSVQFFSFSLEDNKKIRWNYLISGQATNEITAQSWGVEFQLQLWNTMVRLESINPSISDTFISNFLSIGGEEHRASMDASRATLGASLSKVEFVSKVGRACPDNWTGVKGVGWLDVGKGISNFDMLNM